MEFFVQDEEDPQFAQLHQLPHQEEILIAAVRESPLFSAGSAPTMACHERRGDRPHQQDFGPDPPHREETMTHITYALALLRQDELRRQAERRRRIDPAEPSHGGLSVIGVCRRRRVRRLARLRVAVRG